MCVDLEIVILHWYCIAGSTWKKKIEFFKFQHVMKESSANGTPPFYISLEMKRGHNIEVGAYFDFVT